MKKNSKFCAKIILAMLFSAFISPVFSNVTPTSIEILNSMGIVGPFSENSDATISYNFKLEGYSKERVDKYIVLNFEGYDARISIPGYPALPYDVQVIELPNKYVIENVSVDLTSVTYRVESLERKVAPSHQPLYYSTAINQSIVYEENREIYAQNRYFPGCLVKYNVGYGSSGKTIITLHLYPLQYNSATYNLAIFESFKVLIKYNLVQYQEASEEMVIITTPWLIEKVQPLAEYYNSTLGITTKVENTDNIYSTYPPAKNITEFPGFYAPLTSDSAYSTLRSRYNWTLALKIISYINQTKPKNVLLVGSAKDVPPSFYYQSAYLSRMDSWEGWIPTDYFYASADYDLIPERSVGRIPFSDSASVQKVVNKKSFHGTVQRFRYNPTGCETSLWPADTRLVSPTCLASQRFQA
ncbi:MAG: C25 family cysteine peptidase [Candidatus Bathyarchaeia archaeon]